MKLAIGLGIAGLLFILVRLWWLDREPEQADLEAQGYDGMPDAS